MLPKGGYKTPLILFTEFAHRKPVGAPSEAAEASANVMLKKQGEEGGVTLLQTLAVPTSLPVTPEHEAAHQHMPTTGPSPPCSAACPGAGGERYERSPGAQLGQWAGR